MIAPNNPKGIIHKSDKQLLREAGEYIMKLEAELKRMEKEAERGVKDIETLGLMVAKYRICLMAVGIEKRITPKEMEAITMPYMQKQLDELNKQMEAIQLEELEKAKAEFKAKLSRGEKVDFIIKENPDKAADEAAPKP